MNQKKIAWFVHQKIDSLTKLDFIILFSFLLFVILSIWVLPEYEKNLNDLQKDIQSTRTVLKQQYKEKNTQLSKSKTLLGAPVIAISTVYVNQNVQVLDAKYDVNGHQLQLTVSGPIVDILSVTQDLDQYQNVDLLSIGVNQNDIKNQPAVQILLQVQEQK